MGIHADFIRMIDIVYKDAALKIKVNSHVEEGSTQQTVSLKIAPYRLSFTSS